MALPEAARWANRARSFARAAKFEPSVWRVASICAKFAGYEDARTRVAGGGRRTRTEDRYRIRSGGEFFQVPYVRHSRGAPECQEPVPQQRTGQETDQRRYSEGPGVQRADLCGGRAV